MCPCLEPLPLLDVYLADIPAYRDTDGRAVGGGIDPDRLRTSLPELRTCPYRGIRHRHEKKMNMSALRLLREHWPEVRGAFQAMAALDMDVDPDDTPAAAFWRRCFGLSFLPYYLCQRGRSPVDRHALAVSVTAIYNVVLGLTPVAGYFMYRDRFTGERDHRPSAEEVLEAAERTGFLIGRHEVCAGPPKMILEAADCLLGQGDGDAGEIPGVESTDHFARFVHALARLTEHLVLLAERRQQPHKLIAEHCRSAPETKTAVEASIEDLVRDVLQEHVEIAGGALKFTLNSQPFRLSVSDVSLLDTLLGVPGHLPSPRSVKPAEAFAKRCALDARARRQVADSMLRYLAVDDYLQQRCVSLHTELARALDREAATGPLDAPLGQILGPSPIPVVESLAGH